jgi:hypothetical protein
MNLPAPTPSRARALFQPWVTVDNSERIACDWGDSYVSADQDAEPNMLVELDPDDPMAMHLCNVLDLRIATIKQILVTDHSVLADLVRPFFTATWEPQL